MQGLHMRKSEAFELGIMSNIPSYVKSFHMGNDSNYSDIKISKDNVETFIEVKMSDAQLGTPRIKYHNNTWSGITENKITEYACNKINTDSYCKTITNRLSEVHYEKYNIKPTYIGYKIKHYTNKEICPYMINYDTMKKVLVDDYKNQTLLYDESSDSLKCVIEYYLEKKASFMQIGDNFYKLSNENNFTHQEVPMLSGTSYCKIRATFRKSKRWIEIFPTIKFRKLEESEYSLKPNTKKKNPFTDS
jgi:hypothetical protein